MRAHARRGGAAARVAGSAAGRSPRIAPRTCCARSSRSAAAAAAGGRSGGERVALVVLPGLGNQSSDYDDLCAALAQRGHVARTASVARIDWARNAAGLTDPAYWAGTLNPRPTVDWYLERIDAAVAEARAAADTERVALIAHSAGGWLSRVWLQQRQRLDDVAAIVTLGSPLRPPPSAPGVIDQTRGILRYVEERCPGPRELAAAGGRFVCVAGRYLRGSERVTDVQAWIVGQGYKQVCGEAEVDGDGITPVAWAQLDGAEHVTLDGVYHSPLGAGAGRPWYGSADVLPKWEGALPRPAGGAAQALLS